MAISFRGIRKFLAPSWLTTGDGEKIGESLDLLKDAEAQRAFYGLLTRFPQQDPDGTPAPDDALAAMGRDRRVVRGINETATSYAARLLRWLDDRKTAGNPFALMRKLSEYTGTGCRFRTVDRRGNWFTLNIDGSTEYLLKQANWNWDGGAASQGARFWVIIYPPAALWKPQPNNWGDASGPDWGEAANTWGSTATSEQVQTVRAII